MAFLAKKVGIVRCCPIPMKGSRVFTILATIREKVEKITDPRMMSNSVIDTFQTPALSATKNDLTILISGVCKSSY
jgi:hypothetical protein